MKSASILIAAATALLPTAMASPAIQMANAVDWTAQQVARFGEVDIASSGNGEIHAASGWQFVDCGSSPLSNWVPSINLQTDDTIALVSLVQASPMTP
jgi:hypothetical protein